MRKRWRADVVPSPVGGARSHRHGRREARRRASSAPAARRSRSGVRFAVVTCSASPKPARRATCAMTARRPGSPDKAPGPTAVPNPASPFAHTARPCVYSPKRPDRPPLSHTEIRIADHSPAQWMISTPRNRCGCGWGGGRGPPRLDLVPRRERSRPNHGERRARPGRRARTLLRRPGLRGAAPDISSPLPMRGGGRVNGTRGLHDAEQMALRRSGTGARRGTSRGRVGRRCEIGWGLARAIEGRRHGIAQMVGTTAWRVRLVERAGAWPWALRVDPCRSFSRA
jgi:hypothetical protein